MVASSAKVVDLGFAGSQKTSHGSVELHGPLLYRHSSSDQLLVVVEGNSSIGVAKSHT